LGFYTVTLKTAKQKKDFVDDEISMLFPSSIVKDLFPINKTFTSAELLNTITNEKKKCTERLIEIGSTEMLEPMVNTCKFAALQILQIMSNETFVVFVVKESKDYRLF